VSLARSVVAAVDLFLSHSVATVVSAVQVQRWLRDVLAPGGSLFGGPSGGAETGRIELSPVLAERRLEMRRLSDAAPRSGTVVLDHLRTWTRQTPHPGLLSYSPAMPQSLTLRAYAPAAFPTT
jgi:hypothetical protein